MNLIVINYSLRIDFNEKMKIKKTCIFKRVSPYLLQLPCERGGTGRHARFRI